MAPALILRGWDAICKRAEMSVKTARAKSLFGVENRLPVYQDHRGYIANADEIDMWKRAQVRPAGVLPFGAVVQAKLRRSSRSPRLPAVPRRAVKMPNTKPSRQ